MLGKLFRRNRDKDVTVAPSGCFVARDGETLLDTPSIAPIIRSIEELVSVPPQHWEHLYVQPMKRFAAYAQALPASEAHHHAGPGGLLIHTLEVVKYALSLRRGYILPPGAEAEQITRKAEIWSYAVFVAALMHDIGKPIADQEVGICDRHGEVTRVWNPWQGPIASGTFYRVRYIRQRNYKLHTQIAPLFAAKIIPTEGWVWLNTDRDALACTMGSLASDQDLGGSVGDIVHNADGQSVARNLGAGEDSRAATTRAIPLHEKLITALRVLLDNDIPLNKPGAGAFVLNDDLWLVSKRIADALYEHLTREGHTGIPAKNDRIFDVLQEHGFLIPTPESKAVWRADVRIDDWHHELTLLRMPVARVWPHADARPQTRDCIITPIGSNAIQAPAQAPAASSATEPAHTPISQPSQPSLSAPTTAAPSPASTTPPANTAPTQSQGEGQKAPPPSNSSHEGERFLAWLQQGISGGSIKVNEAEARVHVVPEGVLVVSPQTFMDYTQAQHDAELTWQKVQKRLQQLKRHKKTATGENIHLYIVRSERITSGGKLKTSQIKGLLFANPQDIFGNHPIPAPNRVLSAPDR